MNKKLFIIVNIDSFFLSHRKEIAIMAQKDGFEVAIVTHDTGKKIEIESLGLHFIDLPNPKSIQSLFKEVKIFIFLFSLYKKQKPDIVHHVGLKLILYGTIAAQFAGVRNIVNAISGLGIFFS
jgi:UDP-N-acetylglucosamine:LPS N-acetylglucosamine transferase